MAHITFLKMCFYFVDNNKRVGTIATPTLLGINILLVFVTL